MDNVLLELKLAIRAPSEGQHFPKQRPQRWDLDAFQSSRFPFADQHQLHSAECISQMFCLLLAVKETDTNDRQWRRGRHRVFRLHKRTLPATDVGDGFRFRWGFGLRRKNDLVKDSPLKCLPYLHIEESPWLKEANRGRGDTRGYEATSDEYEAGLFVIERAVRRTGT